METAQAQQILLDANNHSRIGAIGQLDSLDTDDTPSENAPLGNYSSNLCTNSLPQENVAEFTSCLPHCPSHLTCSRALHISSASDVSTPSICTNARSHDQDSNPVVDSDRTMTSSTCKHNCDTTSIDVSLAFDIYATTENLLSTSCDDNASVDRLSNSMNFEDASLPLNAVSTVSSDSYISAASVVDFSLFGEFVSREYDRDIPSKEFDQITNQIFRPSHSKPPGHVDTVLAGHVDLFRNETLSAPIRSYRDVAFDSDFHQFIIPGTQIRQVTLSNAEYVRRGIRPSFDLNATDDQVNERQQSLPKHIVPSALINPPSDRPSLGQCSQSGAGYPQPTSGNSEHASYDLGPQDDQSPTKLVVPTGWPTLTNDILVDMHDKGTRIWGSPCSSAKRSVSRWLLCNRSKSTEISRKNEKPTRRSSCNTPSSFASMKSIEFANLSNPENPLSANEVMTCSLSSIMCDPAMQRLSNQCSSQKTEKSAKYILSDITDNNTANNNVNNTEDTSCLADLHRLVSSCSSLFTPLLNERRPQIWDPSDLIGSSFTCGDRSQRDHAFTAYISPATSAVLQSESFNSSDGFVLDKRAANAQLCRNKNRKCSVPEIEKRERESKTFELGTHTYVAECFKPNENTVFNSSKANQFHSMFNDYIACSDHARADLWVHGSDNPTSPSKNSPQRDESNWSSSDVKGNNMMSKTLPVLNKSDQLPNLYNEPFANKQLCSSVMEKRPDNSELLHFQGIRQPIGSLLDDRYPSDERSPFAIFNSGRPSDDVADTLSHSLLKSLRSTVLLHPKKLDDPFPDKSGTKPPFLTISANPSVEFGQPHFISTEDQIAFAASESAGSYGHLSSLAAGQQIGYNATGILFGNQHCNSRQPRRNDEREIEQFMPPVLQSPLTAATCSVPSRMWNSIPTYCEHQPLTQNYHQHNEHVHDPLYLSSGLLYSDSPSHRSNRQTPVIRPSTYRGDPHHTLTSTLLSTLSQLNITDPINDLITNNNSCDISKMSSSYFTQNLNHPSLKQPVQSCPHGVPAAIDPFDWRSGLDKFNPSTCAPFFDWPNNRTLPVARPATCSIMQPEQLMKPFSDVNLLHPTMFNSSASRKLGIIAIRQFRLAVRAGLISVRLLQHHLPHSVRKAICSMFILQLRLQAVYTMAQKSRNNNNNNSMETNQFHENLIIYNVRSIVSEIMNFERDLQTYTRCQHINAGASIPAHLPDCSHQVAHPAHLTGRIERPHRSKMSEQLAAIHNIGDLNHPHVQRMLLNEPLRSYNNFQHALNPNSDLRLNPSHYPPPHINPFYTAINPALVPTQAGMYAVDPFQVTHDPLKRDGCNQFTGFRNTNDGQQRPHDSMSLHALPINHANSMGHLAFNKSKPSAFARYQPFCSPFNNTYQHGELCQNQMVHGCHQLDTPIGFGQPVRYRDIGCFVPSNNTMHQQQLGSIVRAPNQDNAHQILATNSHHLALNNRNWDSHRKAVNNRALDSADALPPFEHASPFITDLGPHSSARRQMMGISANDMLSRFQSSNYDLRHPRAATVNNTALIPNLATSHNNSWLFDECDVGMNPFLVRQALHQHNPLQIRGGSGPTKATLPSDNAMIVPADSTNMMYGITDGTPYCERATGASHIANPYSPLLEQESEHIGSHISDVTLECPYPQYSDVLNNLGSHVLRSVWTQSRSPLSDDLSKSLYSSEDGDRSQWTGFYAPTNLSPSYYQGEVNERVEIEEAELLSLR